MKCTRLKPYAHHANIVIIPLLPCKLTIRSSARDFTFVCPTEILAFNDALPAFKAVNTTVIGVSTDSHFSHLAWAQKPRNEGGLGPDLKLPLLADRSMKISREYGVLLEDLGIALRGMFVIDPKGILRCVIKR